MAKKGNVAVGLLEGSSYGHLRPSTDDSRATVHRGIRRSELPEHRQDKKVARQTAKRVAIVEDENDLLTLFSILVKRLGYLVEFAAHDGNEIVQALSKGSIHPDVILMDYRMPGMNGLQAAEMALRVRPETKIVIVSADDSIKQDALSQGLFFLLKPFSASSMASLLESL
jgi:CheY-like chemotaxis protein